MARKKLPEGYWDDAGRSQKALPGTNPAPKAWTPPDWPCKPDEFAVNLSTATPDYGPPVRACVRDMEQASKLVRERVAGGVGVTEWFSGYGLNDPRAMRVDKISVEDRAGTVRDRFGKVIAEVSRSGKVYNPGDLDQVGRASKALPEGPVPVYDPRQHEARPPPPAFQSGIDWMGWYNSGMRDERRGDRYVDVEHPELRGPVPALNAAGREYVAKTFGLDKCRAVEKWLAQTPKAGG